MSPFLAYNYFLYGTDIRFSMECTKYTSTGTASPTLQRHNNENLKQIFPEKELCGLRFNVLIHVSFGDLYIPRIGLPIMLQENMWTDSGNI